MRKVNQLSQKGKVLHRQCKNVGITPNVPRRTGARALFSGVTSSRGETPTQRPGDIVIQNLEWQREVHEIDKCVMDVTLV